MVTGIEVYAALKFWLPLATAFTLVYKAYTSAKKNIGEWAHTLLNNHLAHVQDATEQTVLETKKTNDLLQSSALKDTETQRYVLDVKMSLAEHNEKELQVWGGIVNTLAILEDRTRRPSVRRKR